MAYIKRIRMKLDEEKMRDSKQEEDETHQPVPDNTGNLVTSKSQFGRSHYPMLDLDLPHQYFPSATPGHGHLYLNIPMTWGECIELMEVLEKLYIIQEGWKRRSIERGYMALRHPNFPKPQNKDHYEFMICDESLQ